MSFDNHFIRKTHLNWLRPLGIAIALMMIASRVATAQSAPSKKCAAFVVGVENYDREELDNLQYVAEDAYTIWRQLKAVSGFDERLSRLIVADRVNNNGSLPPERSASGEQQVFDQLRASHIHESFKEFLSKLDDPELGTVIIYFGGHGIINENAPSQGVNFVASNFGKFPRGAIRVSDLIGDLRATFGRRPDVELVFFANMCHAGALEPGQAGGNPLAPRAKYDKASTVDFEEARNLNLAYFPACGANVSTYEPDNDWESSEFSHFLILGLTGAKRQPSGKITTGLLMDYLRENLKTIPELKSFQREIVLGEVLDHEAKVRQMLGEGLMAVAFDQSGVERDSFLRLAASQFQWCRDNHHAQRFENTVRQLQTRLLRKADTGNLVREVSRAANATDAGSIDPRFREFAKSIDKTDWANDFLGVVFRVGKRERAFDRAGDESWVEWLKSLPNASDVRVFDGPHYYAAETWKTTIDHAIESESQTGGPRDLVLVYTGSAGRPVDGHLDSGGVNSDQVWRTVQKWRRGRVVLIWDAPFGGYFQEIPDQLRDRTSVLLSASQKEGMTFSSSSADSGTTGIMVRMVREGVTEASLKNAYAEATRRFSDDVTSPDSDYEIGKPALVGPVHPVLSGTEWRSPAKIGIPNYWWGITAGVSGLNTDSWDESPSAVPGKAKSGVFNRRDFAMQSQFPMEGTAGTEIDTTGPGGHRSWRTVQTEPTQQAIEPVDLIPNVQSAMASKRSRWHVEIDAMRSADKNYSTEPFKILRFASLNEAAGNSTIASESFIAFWNSINSWSEHEASGSADLIRVRNRAFIRLQDLANATKNRKPVNLKRIHFVPVAAQDYQSPLIGDLGGSRKDIQRWIKAFETLYPDRLTYQQYIPKTCSVEHVRAVVRDACHQCKADELVIFVFSGRGYEDQRGRYLITEEMQIEDTSIHINGYAKPEFSKPPLPVTEINKALADASGNAISIFDCQFASGSDFPLQKHVIATWATRPSQSVPEPFGQETTRFVNRPETNVLSIWWEGTLGDNPAKGSPLTVNLVDAFIEGDTGAYLDWIRDANDAAMAHTTGQRHVDFGMLRPDHGALKYAYSSMSSGGIAAEGNLGSPTFNVSDDSLVRLLDNYDLKMANIDVCLDLLAETGELMQRPEDTIARAALHDVRAALISRFRGDRHASDDRKRRDDYLGRIESRTFGSPRKPHFDAELLKQLDEAEMVSVFVRLQSDRMSRSGEPARGVHQIAEIIEVVGDHWVDREVKRVVFDLATKAFNQDREKMLNEFVSSLERAGDSEILQETISEIRGIGLPSVKVDESFRTVPSTMFGD